MSLFFFFFLFLAFFFFFFFFFEICRLFVPTLVVSYQVIKLTTPKDLCRIRTTNTEIWAQLFKANNVVS